jgi:hypothetical protein
VAGLVALALNGCGGSGGPTVSSTTTPRQTTTTEAAPKKPRGAPKPPVAKAGGLCQSQLGAFVGSMDSLRRRLAVGVTYEQYVDEIKAVRSTYEKVPVQEVQIDCLDAVGTPSEKAFNRYIQAANEWGECVSEAGCESADVEPVLQGRWRVASHFVSEAQRGLRRLAG